MFVTPERTPISQGAAIAASHGRQTAGAQVMPPSAQGRREEGARKIVSGRSWPADRRSSKNSGANRRRA